VRLGRSLALPRFGRLGGSLALPRFVRLGGSLALPRGWRLGGSLALPRGGKRAVWREARTPEGAGSAGASGVFQRRWLRVILR